MDWFRKLALPYKYAIIIGSAVAILLLVIILTFCLTRRRYSKRAKNMRLEALKRHDHYMFDEGRRDRGDPFGLEALEVGHREDHARYSSQARYYRSEDEPKINETSAQSRSLSFSGSLATLPPYPKTSPTYSTSYPVDQINGYQFETGRLPTNDARSPNPLHGSGSLLGHGEYAVYSPSLDGESYLNIPLPESRPGSTTPHMMMNTPYSPVPENGYEAMRSSSRTGFSSPSLSKPQSPYLGTRPGTALSFRAGYETPPSATTVQKSYPPLSRPGTAITRDDLSGSRQPSFRRAQTPRHGLSGNRAQPPVLNGSIPPSSPTIINSVASSPRPGIAGPTSSRGHVSPPFEITEEHPNAPPTWYHGVSSPTVGPTDSLRTGRNRGWSDSPPFPRSGSRDDGTDTVPLVLRPGVPQP